MMAHGNAEQCTKCAKIGLNFVVLAYFVGLHHTTQYDEQQHIVNFNSSQTFAFKIVSDSQRALNARLTSNRVVVKRRTLTVLRASIMPNK